MAIQAWLYRLGMMTTTVGMTLDDAKAKIAIYTEELAGRFPTDHFTPETCAWVAERCKFFPAYGEVVGYISSAWYYTAAGKAQTALLKAQCEAIAAKGRGDWDTSRLEKRVAGLAPGPIADTVRAIARQARMK